MKKEFVLSKQLLRSGTSIGANVEESIGGQIEELEKIGAGFLSGGFAQKMFELRPKNTAN